MTDQMQKEADLAPGKGVADASPHENRGAGKCLEIGLINNMPDATLAATERQFKDLIGHAADMPVRMHFFALAEIARGESAARHIGAHYADIEMLLRGTLDGLIITGCEPKAASLPDEPYWPSLARIIDWAADNTRSTIFSCLAAHAAVLHLDGVKRVPVGEKYSGIFDCAVLTDDPLMRGLGPDLRVPHSRLNGLDAAALAGCGYEILSASPRVGVDIFAKRQKSHFVFLQGHPEYDSESLLREYRRDVTRFLRGERPNFPAVPEDYFDPLVEKHLIAFAERAMDGKSRHPHRELANLLDDVHPEKTWRASAAGLYRNWLRALTARD